MNRRGKPLVSHQAIGATATETGLKVCRAIDGTMYPKRVKASDKERQAFNISRNERRCAWNDTLSANRNPS